MGAVAAATLEHWLAAHGEALGIASATLVVPVPVMLDLSITAVPPLDQMRLPSRLNGSLGSNRAPHEYSAIDALDDHQAVRSWLSLWAATSETYRAYRREAERFLACCVVERGKPLSAASTDDCIAYRDWLGAPEPRHRWVGPSVSRTRPG